MSEEGPSKPSPATAKTSRGTLAAWPGDGGDPVSGAEVRSAVAKCHHMSAQNALHAHQGGVDAVALADLLIAKGLIDPAELAERRTAVEQRLTEQRVREYAGPTLYPSSAPEVPPREPVLVDCDERYKTCRAACCIIYNVYLTGEEVMSGKYRWDLQHPYRLARTAEGHCTYLDRESLRCSIWADRPMVCRGYSCAKDAQIWVDFEQRIGTGAAKDKQAPPRRTS